jgi:sigma-B regulation protein RsbU (phosphoserine phosphatase)
MASPAPDLREEEFEDLEDLYENAPCGYLSLRPNGRIVKVNRTFATWVGHEPEKLIGMRVLDLLNIAGRIFFETHFAPLLRMQGFFNEVALDLKTKDGGTLPVLVNARERRAADGRHLVTRVTVFDATDRRRYERELLEARAAAEAGHKQLAELARTQEVSLLNEREASALREQFIAVLGHDLRNPLGAILTGSQLLLRTPLNERGKSLAVLINNSAKRMAGLIDDVMDFARGRLGGGLPLERDASEPLEPVLRQTVAELQTNAPDRVILTDFAITSPVCCDRRRLGQLASNLLGNAITHGAKDAPIRVSASTEDGELVFYVANSGDPIPPAVRERIFQPFSRGAVRDSLQGLGLGLYIACEIAKAHGGSLDVTSDQAETRFTFRMPLEASPKNGEP